MFFLYSVLFFCILIGVLVFVHELGHFLAARMNGVFVEVFSIGFGPVLYEKKDKHGTKFRVSLFPIGGYVKMFGDADVTSVREAVSDRSEEDLNRISVHRKKPWQRLVIALSGPLANFLFAIVVLFSLSIFCGVPEYSNVIETSGEDSYAYASGLRNGDRIVKINDQEIVKFEDIAHGITASIGKDLNLDIEREKIVQKITIKMHKIVDGQVVPVKILGIAPVEMSYKKIDTMSALVRSCKMTYVLAVNNIAGIFKVITRQVESKNVGGFLSIFDMASKSAEQGVVHFILMLAMFSVMLGAMNLLPIPVLDGGTVLISAIEWIFGKPLNAKFINAIFMIGLIAVVFLMLLGIWNDLSKFKFFVWLENLFK